MVVPNNHGFPTKNDHFGGVLGVPPFKETPIIPVFQNPLVIQDSYLLKVLEQNPFLVLRFVEIMRCDPPSHLTRIVPYTLSPCKFGEFLIVTH